MIDMLLIWPSTKDPYWPCVWFKYLIEWLLLSWKNIKVISWKNISIFNFIYILFTKNIYILSLSEKYIYILIILFPNKKFILGADIPLGDITLFSKILSKKNVVRVFNTQEMLDYYISLYTIKPYHMPIVHGHWIDTTIKTLAPIEFEVFVYFKSVNSLTHKRTEKMKDQILNYLNDNSIKYTYIEYWSYTFVERENILQRTKIWIFVTSIEGYWLAKLESLKYNIPMLNFEQYTCITKRWDIQSNRSTFPIFKDEYWEIFEDISEFHEKYNDVQSKFSQYTPRKTVVKNHDYKFKALQLYWYYSNI